MSEELKYLSLSRRRFLVGASTCLAGIGLGAAGATEYFSNIEDMKPGEFAWHPERQPEGPVSVVVSIDQQRLHLYRNGIRIAVSTVSTGKPGHETPAGVFVVMQKDKHHRSSTYGGAPMPNMNRLTWDGIALHAGALPGYPASHGCVRLPLAFSEKLFGVTHMGTPVIIASSHSDPVELVHPGPVLSGYALHEFDAVIARQEAKLHPKDWTETSGKSFTTLILSVSDGRGELIENDRVVETGSISVGRSDPLGEHVFVMHEARDGRKWAWHAIAHHNLSGSPEPSTDELLSAIRIENAFSRRIAERVHPGSIMIVTEVPLHPDRRSAPDFVIMDAMA